MAEATLTELLDELTVFEAPVAKRESTDSALAFKEAADIYARGIAEIAYRLGQSSEEYARELANLAGAGDARVRSYLYHLARRDWVRFAHSDDPRLEPLELLEYVDVRRAGAIWITVKHYHSRQVIIHNKPVDIDDALARMRQVGYTVHGYGATWYRCWPGRPTPVRTAEDVRRVRQEIVNGTFYIPEDFHLPAGQIDLAFDL